MNDEATHEDGTLTDDAALNALTETLEPEDEVNEEQEEQTAEDNLDDEPDAEDEDESEEDDESEDDSEEEADEQAVYRVRVDGEEVDVELSELISGYQRQSDYTRKTQAVAEERKTFDAELEQIRAQRDAYAQGIEKLQEAIESEEQGITQEELDKLYDEDPYEAMQVERKMRARQEKLGALNAERERISQEQGKEQQAQFDAYIKQQEAALVKAIPEWADEKSGRKGLDEVHNYMASDYGFSDNEIKNVTDNRAIQMIRKAMLYDRLQQSKPKVVKRAKNTRKAIKPNAKGRNANQHKSNMNRLRKTGKAQDAVSALMDIL